MYFFLWKPLILLKTFYLKTLRQGLLSCKSWHFIHSFVYFIHLVKAIYLLKADGGGVKVVKERSRWDGRGGQKWICKFDSKEFGFYSVFSRKPQKTFKEKVMCLKKILLEYWKYKAFVTIQKRDDGGLD